MVLSQAGYEVVLLDNFCNSRKSVLERLQKILGKALPCVEGDVRETSLVTKILQDYKIDAVIHFAGLKAVGESTEKPIEYYANNVQGAISILEAMKLTNVKTLVFSSSATVYGDPQYLPIDESHPTSATNAYGRSKLHIEEMLKDVANSDLDWKIICLRYFNPVGAHESGLIGEDPRGTPNNLMPYITQVAAGILPQLNVYGDDYPTDDGTGIRDYIHVMDLAEGHASAIDFIGSWEIQKTPEPSPRNFDIVNLGSGRGYSVMEMIAAYQQENGVEIVWKINPRRKSDVASSFAKVDKAKNQFGWVAQRSLLVICRSSWAFQRTIEE